MNNEEKILAILTQMQEEQKQMRDDITAIKVRLDYDVDVRFKSIHEGFDVVLKKLDTLDEVKVLAEETRDRVDVIHAIVSEHSANIRELKQAK